MFAVTRNMLYNSRWIDMRLNAAGRLTRPVCGLDRINGGRAMVKPTLVIMAAGMGSRYGGLKQMDPMDEHGNVLMDFSVFDALRAGFESIVFIIKHGIESDFKELIGNRLERHADVKYVYQELDMLPEGFAVPEGRVKPWGTSHAILCCRNVVKGPFVALNADDFYGPAAFKLAYGFLLEHKGENEHAIIGYRIGETLTDHGSVSRGVCVVDERGYLSDIRERTNVIRHGDKAAYEDENGNYITLPADTTVSMNFWAFNPGFMDHLSGDFPRFLSSAIEKNPLKCEDYLPESVRRALGDGRAAVKMLYTPDRWIGVTHKEDKPHVVAAIRGLKDQGIYPEKLWS